MCVSLHHDILHKGLSERPEGDSGVWLLDSISVSQHEDQSPAF